MSCHSGGDSYSKYSRIMPGPQQAPTLSWTGEATYTIDGVDPDAGSNNTVFEFRVNFIDVNFEIL